MMAAPDAWSNTPAGSDLRTCAVSCRRAAIMVTASRRSPTSLASASGPSSRRWPRWTSPCHHGPSGWPSSGVANKKAYLEDRLIEQQWLLVDVAAELAADRRTIRRLMQQAGVKRVRRTARQVAVAERGRRVQAVSWQARRAARLEELGFAELASYLQRRYVEQSWSIKGMRAELGVGRNWLVDQMAHLGLR